MHKKGLTLKGRLTLLTVFLIIVSSVALTIAINEDVKRNIPMTLEAIIGDDDIVQITFQMKEILGNKGLKDNAAEPNDEVLDQKNNIELRDEDKIITPSDYEIAMTNAVSNIYTTSIITLLIIICLCGISAYFIVDKALKPIQDLNENIKTITANNLLSTLEVKGPRDEVKELTISYNQMLAKLNNAFTSQKRFNSSIAHELKTPLAVIKTNIDVFNEGESKSISDYQETMDIVKESIGRLNNMIETMLDLARQEQAPLDDEVDLEEIIEDVVEDLELIATENNVTLEYENVDNLPIIQGNEILLYRAIYNIVENGIKYNVPCGKVNIVSTSNGDNIEIRIQDTGKGMKDEDVAHIFEPFYRVDKLNVDTSSGLGLGLSLAWSTVAVHGGEIEVKSEVNKGTEFIITLKN